MADGYIHGIVIKEGTGEVRVIRSPSPYVVGLVGTATAKDTTLKIEEPRVFFRKKAAFDSIYPPGSKGERGTLYHAVLGVFEQTEATLILVRSKTDSDEDVIAAIEKLAEAESATGYKPKILAAPGLGNKNPKPPTPPPPPPPPPAPGTGTPGSGNTPVPKTIDLPEIADDPAISLVEPRLLLLDSQISA